MGGKGEGAEEVEEKVPYLLRIMEADLAYSHAAVFLEVRPRGVDHGDVVALVACKRSGRVNSVYGALLRLAVFREAALLRRGGCWLGGRPQERRKRKRKNYPTFDRIRLRQLRAVLHQLRRDTLPRPPRLKPEVDMRAGEVVGVELSAGGGTNWYRSRAGARKVGWGRK